ncbi:TetR/AcrR family transcriptional regulator [Cohnella herbarum]|uniref:TetR/AcrR family transcriptional regulator n=1 Tax=Cohnella herbarum TaxID=2728023 RepID=A0A7Z2VNI6_9BACL|nr:TetR/AcrR family transcriptional regulator [Cohnella herbarum]QJD86583.1 TetR/AcrR family transcriptional regulator [Cohnella herbarum]
MTDADKRDRIIAAAYTVLSEKGYDKASTKEIANTAGVAQGLINYYFPSKDLLFAEVFRRETQKYCEAFLPLLPGEDVGPLTFDAIGKMLEIPKSRALQEPEWFRLRYELFAIGLRNENAKQTLKETLETKRKYITDSVESISGFSREQSETVASILYSVIEGLGLQKVADPEFKYDEAYDALAVMLGAYYQAISQKRES